MTIQRFGQPGGDRFPYLCEAANGRQAIVYASQMSEAVNIFRVYNGNLEPYSIRQMSDNE
jgi:hypothetical protein